MRSVCVAFLCLISSVTSAATNGVLRSVSELYDYLNHRYPTDLTFDVTATIGDAGKSNIIAEDDDAYAMIYFPPSMTGRFHYGDRVRIRGSARQSVDFEARLDIHDSELIGKDTPRAATTLRLSDIVGSVREFSKVSTTGTIAEIFPDEMDSEYVLLVLKDGATRLAVSTTCVSRDDVARYFGARVSVTGTYFKAIRGVRKYSGPTIVGAHIQMIEEPPKDLFASAPALETAWYMTPQEIAALDLRSVIGRVLAVWNGRRLILLTNDRRIVNVVLSQKIAPPNAGETIKVVGYPQTDLIFLGLSNARWQASSERVETDATPPLPVSPREILRDRNGDPGITSHFHGQLIKLRGIVRSIPSAESQEQRLYLDSDGFKVPVDISSCPTAADGIEIGYEVEVTGRCLIETSDWSSNDIFPQATGFAVIARSADDFKVLSRPPWWTPARCAAAVLAMLGVVCLVIVWNLVLHTLVKRRAQQLFNADFARATSELRVQDRTQLAVELHDSLSQNLTGVGMKIEAARQCGREDIDGLLRHLDIADKTLRSCRNELRNSLWDLRNDSLEETDLNRAIERTLLPHVENVDLTVRCAVPRDRFTDQTTHALMKIIRELAVNAIRHGHATAIKVAGAIEGDTLFFSVRDNGTGFDPDACPGVRDGHFGIQGIRERLDRFNGQLVYERLARGMRATISFKIVTSGERT